MALWLCGISPQNSCAGKDDSLYCYKAETIRISIGKNNVDQLQGCGLVSEDDTFAN